MPKKSNLPFPHHILPNAVWPAADLEYLELCPVCKTSGRELALSELSDKVFFCAPGFWTSWRCKSCTAEYLSPRPTLTSIHRAYATYYTHEASAPSFMSKVLKILQLSIRHSYLNKKFKYHLRNALPFGWLAYTVLRHKEGITQHTIRHLPPPLPFKNKLLDIGCGGGDFLMTATLLGYAAEGLEIDPAACNIARQRGVKVKLGAVPNSQLAPNQFDFITLNHVVEHFHDPVASLLEIHKLLTPNGRVWIKVPNLNASSRSYLGENACLLDSPRHLVMFDLNSISNLLQQTGFHVQAIIKPSWEDERDSYCGGWMVKNGFGLQSISHCKPPMAVFRAALSAYKKPGHSSENGEVVTIIAQKQTTQPVL